MTTGQGQPTAESAEPSDLDSGVKEGFLVSLATVLFAATFWTAGPTARLIIDGIRIYQLDLALSTYEGNFIIAGFLATLASIIAFIAWLVLRLGVIPRGPIAPVWIVTFASVVLLLTLAGEQVAGVYVRNHLWLIVTFAFLFYLCHGYGRVHIPFHLVTISSVSSAWSQLDLRHRKIPRIRKRAQGNIGLAMNRGPHRITDAFQAARARGETAIVPFVTAGFPERDSTEYIVKSLVYAGADVIEIGVPFSDPLAEGPVIQRSSAVALNNDIKPSDVFDQVATLRATGIETPLVLMGYYNPLLAMGLDTACQRASEAGVDGIIAADLPAAESKPLLDACNRHNLALVPLVALTSTQGALELSCRQASGFVYCVSVLGVTGARAQISNDVQRLVQSVKSMTDLPVAVGFGVSNKQHVDEIGSYADGAVVGSALIRAIEDGDPELAPQIAADFLTSLRR